MKIVCDACSAKYSIADEKVRGKVFKIRCKKCSNIIVVRGASEDAGGEAPAQQPVDNKETKVFDYAGYDSPEAAMAAAASGEAIWHVVIDQEQVGPLTVDEVRARLSAGEIDADSYIWREGFGDWQRLAEVSDFSDVGAEDGSAGMFGGPPVDDGGAAQEDPADLFAAAGGGGGDLFGGAALGGGAGMAAADDGGGLFGSANGATADPGGPVVVESQLRGQRNENSVLFSLNNLASLASDAPKAAAPAASSSASSSGPGMAEVGGTEGSGLIDIRSMAQVYLGDSGPGPASAPKTGSADDLPVFSQASFQAASPVLLPTQSSSANSKLIYGLIGAIAFLVVAATILIVVVLTGGDDEAPAGSQVAQASLPGEASDDDEAAAETPDEEAAAPAEEAPDEPPAPPSPSEAAAAAAADEKEEPAAKKEEERRASRDRDRDRRRRSSSSSRREREREEPKKEPERRDPMAEATSGGCDEVACLVEPDKACCQKYRRRRSSGGSGGGGGGADLPETLTRSDISKGIGRVRGRVTSCGEKHGGSGTVKVKIKIGGNGRVSSAQASGGGSDLRSCVVSAVKRARFPKTQRGMTVTYPFVFR